ncbi:unnamed protein product [Absidia cylindrospora]
MASSGYEIQDAQTYASMGVDYLKYDNCNYEEGISARTRYETMAKAINATERHILLSVCNWGTENTWEWAGEYGHSFRTHDDIYNDWKSIVEILNVHATVVSNSGQGNWADPDILEVGNGKLTVDESRTHFSIWAAMKAPLILGHSLNDIPKELYDIVMNKNVINVNQDPLGLPARRIIHIANDRDIWTGELVNQSMVLVIINYLDKSQVFNIDVNAYGYIGSGIMALDLWKDNKVELENTSYINNLVIQPHGVAMFKLTNGTISGSKGNQFIDIDIGPSTFPEKHTDNLHDSTATRYEAEGLDNMVYGLARRRGCLSCSGGAQVIALGKVNHPQTGTLQFRDIKIEQAGTYKLTIGYLDCFSWTTCGDYWTRRWELRISLNSDQYHVGTWDPMIIALKSLGKMETARQYALGMVLSTEGTINITLDNPNGLAINFLIGPSIDYVDLEWMDGGLGSHGHNTSYLYLLPFWQSHDPLASENAWLVRWLMDYFWECVLVASAIVIAIYGIWHLYNHLMGRRRSYTSIPSSNSSLMETEGAPT